MCVYVHLCMHVSVFVYVSLCVCARACMSVCAHVCGDPWKAEEAPVELELQEVVSYKHGCWELKSGPLEEQLMLLNTKPSLSPPIFA